MAKRIVLKAFESMLYGTCKKDQELDLDDRQAVQLDALGYTAKPEAEAKAEADLKAAQEAAQAKPKAKK